MSQPDGELSGTVEMDGSDDAAMSFLASRREQTEKDAQNAQDGAQDASEDAPVAEVAAEDGEEPTPPQEAEDDDPEIDLGEIKLKKSELKAGYMKDADYRRKTAEAAEVKRIAQAEREQVHAERSHYANHLDVVLGSLQAQLVGDQAALAQLAESDPAEWVKQNAAFQQRYADYQRAFQERQQLANRMTAEQEASAAEWRKGEAAALQDKLPEWKDSKVKEAESRSIAEFLLKTGYTNEELSELFDHRALLVARSAAKWDAHVANLKAAKDKQAKPEPHKPLRAGAAQSQNPQAASGDALRALKKQGDADAAMAWLASRRK